MPDWDAILARRERKLEAHCWLDDKPVKFISATYDYGWDAGSAAVSVRLAELYSWVPMAGSLRLSLGWDGYHEQVAKALVAKKAPSWPPLDNEIGAQGYLSRAQHPYSADVTYTSTDTDQGMVTDLLSKSVVPHTDIAGMSITPLSVADWELKDGFTPWSAIEEVDKVTDHKTFETLRDGVVRRRLIYVGIPAAGYKYSFEEGVNEVRVRRSQSVEAFFNRVIVTGLAGEDIEAIRRVDTALVPRDYTERVSSELIQSELHADAVAAAKLLEGARIPDVLEITLPGRPDVQPGETCRVLNPAIGITSWTNYYIKHVHGEVGANGWFVTVTVEGGTGSAGYQEPQDPEALFEFTITKETFEIGGAQTSVYTVLCDAALSYDPDGTIVGYAWSNNKNADTGTSITYATYFTQAQMDAGDCAITLTVTDADDLTGEITLIIDATIEAVTLRQIYSAATARAEATPSGGATWYTHTPASGSILATPDRAGEDHSCFGNGAVLLYTGDQLATGPTAVHTFDSQINTISICETNASRVAVGCENGKVYATDDAHNLASATWALLCTFAAPVRWLTENPYSPGLYGVSSGSGFYLLYGSTGTAVGWFALGENDTARKHLGSPFANYGCGTLDAGSTELSPVKREDGIPITFPVVSPVVSDVWALAHHPRDDVLFAADDNGAGGARIWRKAAGETAFTLLTTIAGAGFPRHLKSDADHPGVFYLNADDGLYKSFDYSANWFRMRDYSAAGLAGLQLGFGAASWIPEIEVTGKRAYVLGHDGSNGLRFAYTENIWEASPVWVENSTGLPTLALSADARVMADPADPGNVVYIYDQGQLWRNDDVRNGGSWVQKLSRTTTMSWGSADATATNDGRIAISAGTPTRLALCVLNFNQATLAKELIMAHSDDGGDTWSFTTPGPLGDPYSYFYAAGAAISHADPDYIWFGFSTGAGFAHRHWLSDDGGALVTEGWAADCGVDGGFAVVIPPLGVDDPTQQRLVAVGSNTAARVSDDAGATWANWGLEGSRLPVFSLDDADLVAAYNCLTANQVLSKSTDGGSTWATAHSFGGSAQFSVNDLCTMAGNRWYMVRGSTANFAVMTCATADLDEWTDRTGNLLSAVAVPARIAVDPSV